MVPFLLLAVLVAAQLALVGQALWSAGVAARAGARSELVGGEPRTAARATLPPSLREGSKVDESDGVAVAVPVPRLLPLPRLTVRAATIAWTRRVAEQRGQATVELVAAVPALLLAGALALQLLATGYALTLADGAAEAGALALATGHPVVQAARQALPSWADDDVDVEVGGGRVTVRLRPPSLLHSVADLLAVTSSAAARPKK